MGLLERQVLPERRESLDPRVVAVMSDHRVLLELKAILDPPVSPDRRV